MQPTGTGRIPSGNQASCLGSWLEFSCKAPTYWNGNKTRQLVESSASADFLTTPTRHMKGWFMQGSASIAHLLCLKLTEWDANVFPFPCIFVQYLAIRLCNLFKVSAQNSSANTESNEFALNVLWTQLQMEHVDLQSWPQTNVHGYKHEAFSGHGVN